MNWFDIQVNGYGGVDFNQEELSADDLHEACVRLTADGAGGILATIITESVPKMESRIRRLVSLRAADPLVKRVIAGFHIEGPFLSSEPGYRGAHPQDALLAADVGIAGRLFDAAGGLMRIFTLAPERDPGGQVTAMLAERGVIVSAGHTNAGIEDLNRAIDCGLSMFTHLGNGCPGILPRHDNIIQRALFLRRHLCLCFIADGVHVPFPALKNYLDLARDAAGCLVTSDANAAAGLGPGRYRIGRWAFEVGEDLAVWSPDRTHLLGSAVSLSVAQNYLRQKLGLAEEKIVQLTGTEPRRIFGAEQRSPEASPLS